MAATEKYFIISPVRNEAANIEKTIQSVLRQTVRPVEWIIVNDGSTDNTAKIVDACTSRINWIRAVHRKTREQRSPGTGVIEAFYRGYELMKNQDWDFIVKLDGDLSFDETYFEECFSYFRRIPRLGIGGGTICQKVNNVLEAESKIDPRFHVRGATKIYRKACWDAIDGLIKAPGWDTLDEIKANMLGWETLSFQNLRVLHYRFTGTADGQWKNWIKNGRANYIAGYHPAFMTLKCLRRILQKPYFIQSLGLFWGYISGYLQNVQQVDDPELIRYLRKQQINRLLFRPSIWRYSYSGFQTDEIV